MQFILRHKFNAHTPTGVCGQHTAKLLQTQFIVIDADYQPPFLVSADRAAQHATSRHPLMAAFFIIKREMNG